MELSEQAAQELAEGSTAIGQVVELEARVAELEARDLQLEANKVKAEDALRKEKRGKESGRCLPSPFHTVLSLTCFCFRARGLHQGQRGAAESSGRWLRRGRPPPRRSFAWSSRLGLVRSGNHTAMCFLSFVRLGLT